METIEEKKPKFYYRDLRSNAETIADEVLKERVLRGLEVLQEKHGDDWVEHIDLKTLALDRADRCILGQVYRDEGDYFTGLSDLDIRHPWDYGFSISGEDDEMGEEGISFSHLQKAWQTVFGKK